MAEDIIAPPTRSFPPLSGGHGYTTASSASSPLRQRPLGRASIYNETARAQDRRRSSILSEHALDDARASLRSSTDDLLSPRPYGSGRLSGSNEVSNWHSAPLAFALLPALGGMLFQNGGAVVTDIMLLGLAGVFLNWAVRLPWEWYHSSQAIRLQDPYGSGVIVEESSEDEQISPTSPESSKAPATAEETPVTPKRRKSPDSRSQPRNKASAELRRHEVLALFCCFLFPLLGAYLLHAIRFQLSRPSEGLVNNFNLTIFLLASEVRPLAHLVRIVRSRTLYLQRIVSENPYQDSPYEAQVLELSKRVGELEARSAVEFNDAGDSTQAGKANSAVSADVRRSLQPDLDALNRAVRRYEKKATLQTMQTEARLLDLEARLSDALSLAAVAAQSGQRNGGFADIIFDWVSAALLLPLQLLWGFLSLPATAVGRILGFGRGHARGRGKKDGKYVVHGRVVSERVQGRGKKV